MSIEDDINDLKRPIHIGTSGHIGDHQKIAGVLEQLKELLDNIENQHDGGQL